GKRIAVRESTVTAPVNSAAAAFPFDSQNFVRLELFDNRGSLLSQNFYWPAVPPATVLAAHSRRISPDKVTVEITNHGRAIALLIRLTLRRAGGSRVLPSYFSDNYFELLPGEQREIVIEGPTLGNLEVTASASNAPILTAPVE